MKLKEYPVTTEELIAWKAHLKKKTKEDLVEFILIKVMGDPKFSKEAYYRLFPELMTTEEYLEGYLAYIEDERREDAPSLSDMIHFTEDLMEKAEEEVSLLVQCKVYTAIIFILNDILMDGIERDQRMEDLLNTLMDECLTFLEEEMEEKTGYMSAAEIMEVKDHLTFMQRRYKPVDRGDRMRQAIKTLTDLTRDRTKINEEGGYVRGAAYYAGLDERKAQYDALRKEQDDIKRKKEEAVKKELNAYIIALCNLYGMVHKKKVMDIYNMQNTEKITLKDVENLQENLPKEVDEAWIDVHQGYFVSSSILEHREFLYYIREKGSKPYYIPEKEELLKYVDGFYFEKTKEYHQLVQGLKKCFGIDQEKAEDVAEDLVAICQFDSSTQRIFGRFEELGLVFRDEKDIKKMGKLTMNLMNHTRIWENNGHTPEEIFTMEEKNRLKPAPLLSTSYLTSDDKTGKKR